MNSDELKWLEGRLTFHRYGRLLYTNFAMRVAFRYGPDGIAHHLFWRFWWISGGFK